MSVLINTINPISGYRLTEKIYTGNKTLVYRGIREEDQKSVIIKLMRNEYPTFAEIAQFRNQYNIIKNLDLKGIVKPLVLENYRNGYALIMEDFGGVSLKEWQSSHGRIEANSLALDEFFTIAIEVTSILEGLHRDRIIHKDIKPANILIHPTSGEVKVIDFSLATLLPREIQFITNPNVLEGTLAYISPEQTGRMNRGIDYRTDFYSLGVTFFELLTGQLPFTTTDPMELVYCHIAKEPPKVNQINSNIPQILSDLIGKLIAKNAEDRYQSTQGLKHDLEKCYQFWQDTKNIPLFELGLRDFSDHFLIPEKLYGRQSEVETLLAAFERVADGTTEMVLVTGSSGIGKTAVVNEVHKPIVRQRSYFIKGKFDQFQRDIPLSGLVQAFRDLIGQLLSETDYQIQQWKTNLLSALGEQSQIIIDVIPELELIIGKQPEIAEISGSAAQNRFNLLFQRFIQVFATKEHPLVIFLDDLQWADVTSLKFIQLLMNENTSSQIVSETGKPAEIAGGLLLICAYRDNEVSNAHPLYLKLQEIENRGVNISKINLNPLTQGDLNSLITETLNCQESMAVPLTQMVFAKTQGNPFFSNQFLHSLYDKNLIKFNFDNGYWEYDLGEIKALSLTDDVVKFMAMQIEKLPIQTQKVLMFAACIGNAFDLKTLAIIHEKSAQDTSLDLLPALRNGLILPENDAYKLFQDAQDSVINIEHQQKQPLQISNFQFPKYKFVHDRVQQAAYYLIPVDQKKPIHLKIGLLLLSNIPISEREEKIFELINQFNIALEFITHQSKRNHLAEMNLTAGRKALASTAYSSALKYLKIGIELLADDSWDNYYELTLALYETAAEAAYLSGEFEEMEELVKVVLAKAKKLLEKVKVYEVQVQAYGAQGKALEAVNIALAFLKLLGVDFPKNLSPNDVQIAMLETASHLAGKDIEDLINLPQMTDERALVVMRILSNTTAFAYTAIPALFPLIVLKQINLSIHYGNGPLSAFSYVAYGVMLCGVVGDIESGYQFGKLAASMLSRFHTKEVTLKVIETFNQLIRPWKEHIRDTLKPLIEAYSSNLETGDLEFGSYALYAYSYSAYFIGQELASLEPEVANYSKAIRQIKQERAFYWNEIYRQTILNLLGNVDNHCYLMGEAYNEEKMLPIHIKSNDGIALFFLFVCKLQLCYLLTNYPQAVDNARQAEKYLYAGIGMLLSAQFYFYDSLAQLAVYSDIKPEKQQEIMLKVTANQAKMEQWAHHAPMNYLHKFYLVEAEKYRVTGKYVEAMDNYDRAISLAQQYGYIHEEAIANELAAKLYFEWGKVKIAKTYLLDAYYGYIYWGAKTKVRELEKRYSQLLNPIIQEERIRLNSSRKNISDEIHLSTHSSHQTMIGSKTSISDSLDLLAVIKASQALSGEMEMERLISVLMEVVMENAGASKSAFILSKGANLSLTVTAVSVNSNEICPCIKFPSVHIEASEDVPINLINYVKRTREILVSDDLKINTFLVDDSYLRLHKPKSFLCIPILNQGKLLGILYLENNLTAGSFTHDRVEIIKLLTTQAAIALENAILYNNLAEAKKDLEEYNHSLEDKVDARTQELNEKNQSLQQAIQELRRTQTQLIQTEKMSSLGQMIAGIAHEINNPINFIHGNITHISEYVQELVELIDICQQEDYSPDLINQKLEELDLDFLISDLLKILDSMKLGSSRIRNIVLGLRNFSRLDESAMKLANIHDGLENTLMILQHRLQEKSDRPEIEVIKEYTKLPEVNCYAGQLNQVFMNILTNAIDALEDSVTNNKIAKPTIRLCTELGELNTVKIRIIDNGCGIPELTQKKIFDPFFTTKPVGSGTGLGLSISYQVIVDQHKGELSCLSTPGEGTEFIIEIPM
ncbi:AAA family ATPase [Tolypothrix sp. FACHB-123]|uniref:trifunctional serine/threonine-protein kinase/ATP-binding protein/sensor histidine kinase n=1 Tax=Tolypothrix sp. FACHB-123 TaxID=2692868 RepID=UPI0016869498|nr:ATP-binding sensor histidine kinase [Tolypothrix sp. FACHB-123]MBD2355543.1 AAA family ATPase [Tolypothrix sp. FACHB-123]